MTAGKVYLVGAGPGDPELMTLKAARTLALADVVLVDALVSRGCLAHARSDALVIEVGKRGGCMATPQEFIERLLVQYARQGKVVARLKGGDPFVFGRGGEELEAVRAAGIEVEVVPGLTAGTALPALLGIPATHRELARCVSFVTGHAKDGSEPDWGALARSGGTIVVYMGLASLERIAASLAAAGMDPGTPACLIQDGSLKSQKVRVATLGTLAKDGFSTPALLVIGEVVRFRKGHGMKTQARAA